MYGYRNFISNYFRKTRLDFGRNSLPFWLCLVLALSASVACFAGSYDGFPWIDHSGYVAFFTKRPTRYYTEQEILDYWDSYLPSRAPSFSSVDDVYSWLSNNGYFESLTPPSLAAITNSERIVDFGELYRDETNYLVSVAIAPSFGDNHSESSRNVYLFPAYFSSRHGLGFIGPDGLDPFGSSPAFGGEMSWGGSYGLFTTNLITTDPWLFSDYEENFPIVYPSQLLPPESLFRRSRAWFKGKLRILSTYYIFPESPLMGRLESSTGFPVTRSQAFSMVDEFLLPWYWQTTSGLVWWREDDTLKIKNVLRFHSSSTNQPTDQ